MEQNQHGGGQNKGRRGHFQRGRRGHERRGQGAQESRSPQVPEPQGQRGEHVDVEQIMRDIRARIAHRHGIDLSEPQIRELAARRLEAILDPRNVDPSLLEQLRKAAGERTAPEVKPSSAEPAYTFEDTTLYESHRGLLRAVRKLLNPILKLFFNPNPLISALNTQARLNAEAGARESFREQRQAEWNALHYEILRRVVTENSRLSVEMQALALRVESLAARVDFADRRVRLIEAGGARQSGRPSQDASVPSIATPTTVAAQSVEADGGAASVSADGASGDPQRRRRRRRRGRRGGGTLGDAGPAQTDATVSPSEAMGEDADDGPDELLESSDAGESDTPKSSTATIAATESAGFAADSAPNEAESAGDTSFEAPSTPSREPDPDLTS